MKNINKAVALLFVFSGLMALASTASASPVSYSFSTVSEYHNGYQRQRPNYREQHYNQRRYNQQRYYQQPPVVNIYNQQPTYRNGGYSHHYQPRREVIVREHYYSRERIKTKDLIKGAGVVIGIHCLLGGC